MQTHLRVTAILFLIISGLLAVGAVTASIAFSRTSAPSARRTTAAGVSLRSSSTIVGTGSSAPAASRGATRRSAHAVSNDLVAMMATSIAAGGND